MPLLRVQLHSVSKYVSALQGAGQTRLERERKGMRQEMRSRAVTEIMKLGVDNLK